MATEQLIGKTCPYCKTRLTEEDDIVVCSHCDMPHHKDCWLENQGCTTFGCVGTIQSADAFEGAQTGYGGEGEFCGEARFSEDRAARCPACGFAYRPGDVFCGDCGRPLNAGTRMPPRDTDPPRYGEDAYRADAFPNASDEERYVGTNYAYYHAKFFEMRQRDKNTSWNWAAFLFAPYWCCYRKMYGPGLGILAIELVLWFAGLAGNVLSLAGSIVFGIFANNIYMRHIEKAVCEFAGLPISQKVQHLQSKSGVSVAAAILSAVGFAILLALLQL